MAFKLYDIDRDGFVDAEEMATVRISLLLRAAPSFLTCCSEAFLTRLSSAQKCDQPASQWRTSLVTLTCICCRMHADAHASAIKLCVR